jgi:hypothetical protein
MTAAFVPRAPARFPAVSNYAKLQKEQAAVAAQAAALASGAPVGPTHVDNGVLTFTPANTYIEGTNRLGANGGGMYLNTYTVSFEFMMSAALPSKAGSRLVLFQPDTAFLIPLGAFSVDHKGTCRIGDEEGRTLPGVVAPNVFHHVVIAVKCGNGLNGQETGSVGFYIDGAAMFQADHNPEFDISRDYGFALRDQYCLFLLQGADDLPQPTISIRHLQIEKSFASVASVKAMMAKSLSFTPSVQNLVFDFSSKMPVGADINGKLVGFGRGGASAAPGAYFMLQNYFSKEQGRPLSTWTLALDMMLVPGKDFGADQKAALVVTNSGADTQAALFYISGTGEISDGNVSADSKVKFELGSWQRVVMRRDNFGAVQLFVNGVFVMQNCRYLKSQTALMGDVCKVFFSNDGSTLQGGVLKRAEIFKCVFLFFFLH